MPEPRISDDDFISIWLKWEGQATKIAKATGILERNVYTRRNNIETRRGIKLPSSFNSRTNRPKEYVDKIGHRITLTVKDGIVVIFSDAHYWPNDKPVAHAALVRFIKKKKPCVVICNGDAFDGARISRHPPTGWSRMPDVADELDYCKRMLSEIEEAAADKAKLCWNMGNHDSRFSGRLAQLAPDYVRVVGTDLPDHFPTWNVAWSTFINDDVVVKHRLKGGTHATYNNTREAGRTMVTGHLHRLLITPVTDYNGRRYGVDCGMISDFGPDVPKFGYAEDSPFNWQSGFVVLHFRGGVLMPPELAMCQPNKTCLFRGEPI